jgi:dihydroneopterin aldolase
MDKLTLRGMSFYAHHGVTEDERSLGGRFEVDCELWTDLRPVGAADDLTFGVDARNLYELVSSVVLKTRLHTLEALAERIAATAREKYAPERVVVRVRKLNPKPVGDADCLEVEIERGA